MKKTIRLTESDLVHLIKRIVNEQQESQCTKEEYIRLENEFAKSLAFAGIKLSNQENLEVQPSCPIEMDLPQNINNEQKSLVSKVLTKLKQMDKGQLKLALKELVDTSRKLEKMSQTQGVSIAEGDSGTFLTVIGIGAATYLLAGPVIAFIILATIVILSRLIFRGSCAERGGRRGSGCNRRSGLGKRRRY